MVMAETAFGRSGPGIGIRIPFELPQQPVSCAGRVRAARDPLRIPSLRSALIGSPSFRNDVLRSEGRKKGARFRRFLSKTRRNIRRLLIEKTAMVRPFLLERAVFAHVWGV